MYNVIKAALEATPKKDVRYYLLGVHVTRQDNIIIFEATDGYVAFRSTIDCNDNQTLLEKYESIAEGTDVILCAKSLTNVMKMFNKKSQVTLAVSTDGAASINGVSIDTINAVYPDVGRVISDTLSKDGKTNTVGITLDLMIKSMKILKCLDTSKSPCVEMGITSPTNPIVFQKKYAELDTIVILMPCRV